jgi:PEP-CTERM motif
MRCARPVIVLSLVGLLVAPAAHATSLVLSPSSASVLAGDAVNVDVLFSGPTVGAFDLTVGFNPSVLALLGVTFGPFLGNVGLGEALTDFLLPTPGLVNFAELSLLFPSDLDALQPPAFRLATLNYRATTAGSSAFAFVGDVRVDDPFGNKLIPEPSTLGLLGLGLLGALGGARHRSRGREAPRPQPPAMIPPIGDR